MLTQIGKRGNWGEVKEMGEDKKERLLYRTIPMIY